MLSTNPVVRAARLIRKLSRVRLRAWEDIKYHFIMPSPRRAVRIRGLHAAEDTVFLSGKPAEIPCCTVADRLDCETLFFAILLVKLACLMLILVQY